MRYRISAELFIYLEDFSRTAQLPFVYQDLLRYNYSIQLSNKAGQDTLWETVFYTPQETEELNLSLIHISEPTRPY